MQIPHKKVKLPAHITLLERLAKTSLAQFRIPLERPCNSGTDSLLKQRHQFFKENRFEKLLLSSLRIPSR